MKECYVWNPVYNFVMKIKKEYETKFGNINYYSKIKRVNEFGLEYETGVLEYWVEKLNNDEYNNWIEPLQFTYYKTLVLIRYGLAEMQQRLWEDENSIYRECRSIVIDLKEEELVLTPWKKFFNLGEIEQNKLENILEEIKVAKVVEFTNKLDGSMQNARWYKNEILMSGSQALDREQSWRLADGYSLLTENIKKMIKENEEFTFSFEYISLKDSHVVNYEKSQEGLYLIGMRSVYTGRELHYYEIKKYADKYNVRMTEFEDITLEQALDKSEVYKAHEKEGWVINIDGHRIKLKCNDYSQLHRMLDRLSSINVIIKNIADNTYDDLISKVPELYKPRVEKIAKLIFNYVQNTNEEVEKYYLFAPKSSRKEFMIWVENNVPKELKNYVRSKYLGGEYNVLKTKSNRYKKLCDMNMVENYSVLFSSQK